MLFFSIFSKFIFPVSSSTSTNTGVAPTNETTFAVAIKVEEGNITSSFGPIFNAFNTRNAPVVHEETPIAYSISTIIGKFVF